MSTRQRARAARRTAGRVAGNRGRAPEQATLTEMQAAMRALFAALVTEGLMEVGERDADGEPVSWQATAAGTAAGL